MMVLINSAERLKVDVSLMNLHIGHIFRILIFHFFIFLVNLLEMIITLYQMNEYFISR